MKKTIISVIGKDRVGITADVSAVCAEHGVNILDITQSVMQDMFVMVMLTEISESVPLTDFKAAMKNLAEKSGLDIRVMHEDIFNSMHRI